MDDSSRLLHILVVISSLRTCRKYYEGKASPEDYLQMRLFPSNLEALGVSDSLENELDDLRQGEEDKNKALTIRNYLNLENTLQNMFYIEIEKGIPDDVKNITLDDEFLGDIPRTLESLTI